MFRPPTKYSEYLQDVQKSIDYILKRVNATTVTKIVAGTNVTISPASGTGVVTINASGGGGGGLPAGGTTGQILAKINNVDYNAEWIDNYALWTSTVKHEVKAGEAINKGQAVYVSSADGTNMIVSKASNALEATSSKTLGILAQSLAHNAKGFVITEGLLAGIDTSAAGAAGDPVWLGTDGNLLFGLANKPYAPANMVSIGVVTRKNSSNGEIFIRIQNGFELDELHNVDARNPNNNDGIFYNSTTQLWEHKPVSAVYATPTLAQVTTAGNTTTNSIGIGTTGPVDFNLVVEGIMQVRNAASSFTGLRIDSASIRRRDTGTFSLGTNDTISFNIFAPTNNIGINTTTDAGYKLDVNGTLRATGIVYADSTINQPANFGNKLLFMGSGNYSKIALADGTNWSIDYHSGTTVGNVGYHRFYTGSTSGWVERMRIDNNGNVGIGTSNPLYKLHVTDSAGDIVYILASTGQSAIIGATGSGTNRMYIGYSPGAENISITSSGVVRLNSITSGNVLIGTTTDAGYKLDVNGIARVGDSGGSGQLYIKGFAGTGQYLYLDDGSKVWSLVGATNYSIQENGTSRLTIKEGGNVGIGTTTPTAKLQIKGTGDSSVWVTTDDFNTGSNTGSVVRIGTRSSTGNTQGWIDVLNSGVSSYGNLILTGFGGNVLIGTTTDAGYKLDVNGTFRAIGPSTGVYLGYNVDIQNQLLANALYIRSGSNILAGLEAYNTGVGGIQLQSSPSQPIIRGAYNDDTTIFPARNTVDNFGDVVIQGGGSERVRFKANGNVGIGTTNPTVKLQVNGVTRIQDPGSNSAIVFTYGTGGWIQVIDVSNTEAIRLRTGGASYINTGQNFLIGTTTDAGYKLDVVGADSRFNGVRVGVGAGGVGSNTVVGNGALNANTSGYENTAIGYQSSYSLTGGLSNTAVGYQSLYLSTVGEANTAIGWYALRANTSDYITAVGYQALKSNTFGQSNTAVGANALEANTSGQNNTSVGWFSLQSNTTGSQNTALGSAALNVNSTGISNTAVGYIALEIVSTGNQNTAIGVQAGKSITTASNNTIVGSSALRNSTGSDNTAIGYQAGYYGVANTTGTNNIFIGNLSTGVSATESNRTWIGNSSTTSTWLAGNVLIGTTTDNGNKLNVNGDVSAQAYKVNNVLGFTGIFNVPTNPPGQQNIDIQGGIVINIF